MAILEDLKRNPIYIVLQGPSAEKLRGHQYNDPNIIWASLNKISPVEELIQRKLRIFYCASLERTRQLGEEISGYLSRDDVLFLTNNEIIRYYPQIQIAQKKLFVSDFGYGFSSLTAMLINLSRLFARKIYLFGADGYANSSKKVYFCQEEYEGENFPERQKSIFSDTLAMNKLFWDMMEEFAPKPFPRIINMNPDSAINCFEKRKEIK